VNFRKSITETCRVPVSSGVSTGTCFVNIVAIANEAHNFTVAYCSKTGQRASLV
jgi:hypothetical protein